MHNSLSYVFIFKFFKLKCTDVFSLYWLDTKVQEFGEKIQKFTIIP